MNVLATNIEWKTDGQPLDECCLPENIVIIGVPDNVTYGELNDLIGSLILDGFGFNFSTFSWERFGRTHDTHAGGGFFPQRLGILHWK